ncbi:MAG: DMT family transporter [Candidatus Peregrinibacteria bacterium]
MQLTATTLTGLRLWKKAEHTTLSSGWMALVITVLAGSTTSAFGKQLTNVFSPLSMLFMSEVMMLLFAVLSFGFLPIVRTLMKLKRREIIPLCIAGFLNGVVASAFWFAGLAQTSAVNAQLFGITEMLFLVILAVIFARQQFSSHHAVGGGIILFGVIVVALEGFTDGLTLRAGDMLITLSCLLYAVGATVVSRYLRTVTPQIIIVVRSGVAIACFFLVSPFIAHPFRAELAAFPLALLPVLLSYGFIARFVMMFSYYESIERLPVTTVSLLGTLTIAGSTLFAHLYLGETVYWYQVVGGTLIVAGACAVYARGIFRNLAHEVHHLKVGQR